MKYSNQKNLIFSGSSLAVQALVLFKIAFFTLIFFFGIFLITPGLAQADYYASGILKSENVLSKADVTDISEFLVVATIPASTTVSISFSQDNSIYFSASGTKGAWTNANTGTTTIDMSGLSWTGELLFYKLKLETSNASTTPTVSEIRVNYTGTAVPTVSGDYYYGTGILQSKNMLNGLSVATIDGFYATTTIPSGTEVLVSFSQDKSIYYSASGTKGAWTTLSEGGNFVDLSGLSWTGASFYYKTKLVAILDNAMTPTVTDVRVTYSESGGIIVSPGDYYYLGVLLSTDLLASTTDVLTGYERFGYTIAYLPFGATVKVQFSQDQLNWYSSDGTQWGYDTLSYGDHLSPNSSLDLFGLGWKGGSSFYYKIKYQLGADNSTSPIIRDAGLNYYSMRMAEGNTRAGPVAYWKFDEGYGATVHDSSGNGNDGTVTPLTGGTNTNVSQMWSLDGKYNKAMEFDGTDDYVDTNVSLAQNDFTINAWFKASADVSSYRAIISKETTVGGPWNYRILVGQTTGYLIADIHDGTNSQTLTTDYSVADNIWHFVSYKRDSIANTVSLYLDGELVQTKTDPTTGAEQNSQEVWIGKSYYSGGSYPFAGEIDELKIFNYTLSDDEIKQEYNRGAGAVFGSTGTDSSGNVVNSDSREYCVPGDTATCNPPVMHLLSKQKSGTTLPDISGNGNDGTLGGDGLGTDLPTWTRGKNGVGLEFDGVDDYVSVSSSNVVDKSQITFTGWIKPDNVTSGYQGIYSERLDSDCGDNPFLLALYEEDVGIDGINVVFEVNGVKIFNPSIELVAEEWYFIAAIFDSVTDNHYLYVDNNKYYTNSALSAIGSLTMNTKIGLTTCNSYFNGDLNDIKIYDYARTPAQIAWEYNRGKPIAHWDFDECSGSIAHDQSGNGNDGTITIGATGSQTNFGNCSTASTTTAWYNGMDGKTNSSLNFDGTDDYIDMGSPVVSLDDFTISAFFKADTTTGYDIILGQYASAQAGRLGFGLNDGKLFSRLGDTSGEGDSISIGAWYHYLVKRSGSTVTGYLNGIENFSYSSSDTVYQSANTIIGSVTISIDRFDGQIDEVKIYNYALTEAQVKTEYNNGAINFGN